MDYIHVKNLDKYQPGYTDRRHIWAKIYYETFLDEAVQALCEIDRYRFWSLIVFEVYTQRPVPLTDTNLKIMGWSKSKRRIPLSLQMLHTLVEVRNIETKPTVTQSRVEESRIEESKYISIFDQARKEFYGTKRGLQTEYDNLRKKHIDWEKILPLLLPAIKSQIISRERLRLKDAFVPPPKNFKTWINNRCWEEVTPEKPKIPKPLCACGCGKEAHNYVDRQGFNSSECRIKVVGW